MLLGLLYFEDAEDTYMSIFSDIKKQFEKMEKEAQVEKEKKERERKEKERIEKAEHERIIKEIREEYIKKLPFKSLDVIAMRLVMFNGQYFFKDIGIEFFRKNGTRCFLSNRDHCKKTEADYYLTTYEPDDVCEVLSSVIPRLADATLHTSDDARYSDIYAKTTWKYLAVDEKYLKTFVGDQEIINLNMELYSRLVGVVDAWEQMGESELLKKLDHNIYKSWIKRIDSCRKVIEERRKVERKQRDKDKVEKEMRQRAEESEKQSQLAEERQKRLDEEARIRKEKFMAELEARHAEEERREIERQEQIIAAGKKGEEEVNYALKWLDKSYQVLRGGGEKIKIQNTEFIDEVQEYDHIVIGPAGIVLIETKAYSGKINIDKDGNWTRFKNDGWVGTVNPVQQVRRHEKLIHSFIPDDIPIYSYICLANSNVVIEGSENSIVPIVKSDLIVEHIENLEIKNELTKKDIDDCIQLIMKHMV